MSRQKDKKLKKLKKQRLLPYILGIIFVTLILFLIIVAVSIILLTNIFMNKFDECVNNSKKIIQIIETKWDGESEEEFEQIYQSILEFVPESEEICVYDLNKNIIYQSGEDLPDWNIAEEELSTDETVWMLTSDEDSFFYLKNGESCVNSKPLQEYLEYFIYGEETPEDQYFDIEILKVKMWTAMKCDNYYICIKNSMSITETEIAFPIVILMVLSSLEVVLVIYYLTSIISLVVERRKVVRILETDMITGGNNLQFFVKKGKKILKKNKNKSNYAVVILRLEKYRNFCSCYGVHEGEELLEYIYVTLNKMISKKELVAHADKSDFALLLSYTTEEELRNRLTDFVTHLHNSSTKQGLEFSIGICKTDVVEGSVDTLFNYAGVAIGKLAPDSDDRTILFTDKMRQEEFWNRRVENDLDRAIANKEFMVYLQPKYSTKEERLSGAEALIRWNHPTEGFVPPFKFIPILEKNGSIIKIDDYMITEVAKLQAKWIAEGKEVVPISVNISRVHFARTDLAEHISSLVDEYNVPHHLIELELTESAFFDDKALLLETIKKLKEFGFEISMDDFGAGYSSLNSLKELPLDVLKLDAGFFREEDTDGRGKMIIGDTISLAKKLDMKIVAEGIETREQVDFLTTMDCDLIQGYYFVKPMPVSDFEEKAFP